MKLVKLIPKKGTKYHFGAGKLNSTDIVFHSDSLFSAFVNNYTKLFGEFPIKVPKFSSVYFFSGDTLFFPRPYMKIDFDSPNIKKLKKVRFISYGILKEINSKFSRIKLSDEFACLENETLPEINLFMEQKVLLTRSQEEQTLPFECECFEIRNGGFYFLMENLTDDVKISQALNMIKHEGLGGKRSTGKGLFDKILVEHFEYEIKGDNYFSMSLISPNDGEYSKAQSYNLVERKGFIYSPFISVVYRKNPLIMFSEGSIFNEKIEGRIRTIAKPQGSLNHNVYKDGRAFMMRI
jgi:CRISPR-associated protein Csm4